MSVLCHLLQHLRDEITDITPEQVQRTFKTNILRCVQFECVILLSSLHHVAHTSEQASHTLLLRLSLNCIFPLSQHAQLLLFVKGRIDSSEARIVHHHVHLSRGLQR